jgi:hypothetical protein
MNRKMNSERQSWLQRLSLELWSLGALRWFLRSCGVWDMNNLLRVESRERPQCRLESVMMKLVRTFALND